MSDGDPNRWERIKALFAEALDLPPAERAGLLERVAQDDLALGREVAALLAAHDRSEGLMDSPTLPPETWGAGAAAAPADGPPPGGVGRYRILSRLGAGGMGEVLLAHDPVLERHVALKLLPAELARHPRRRASFLREARAAASLNHPNITTIHEVGEADGRDFIAFEYVDGRTLRARLADGALGLQELLAVALPLADALAYAHERGIVHRDIKTANVMVSDRGLPKLLDFGLARTQQGAEDGGGGGGAAAPGSKAASSRAQDTLTGAVAGTPSAMSPEQARGEAMDHRTDVFSFGSLLYEMAAGHPAFEDKDLASTLEAVKSREPPPLREARPDLPAALSDIVERALQKDPARRYQRMADLAGELRKLSQQEAAKSGGGRRRAAVLVLLLAGVVVLTIVMSQGSEPPPPPPAAPPPAALRSNVAAVMAFESRDDPEDKEQIGAMLTRLLTTHLSVSGHLDVLSQQKLRDVATQAGQGDGSLDRAGATQVAQQAGAGTLIVGEFLHGDGTLRATAEVVDVASGQTLASAQAQGLGAKDVFDMAEALGRQIREVLREPEMTADERRALSDQLTTSVEAYRAFVRGLEKLLQNDPAGAVESLNEAVAIDPAFALAQYRLWMALIWTGQFEESGKARDRALAFRDKLPPDLREMLDVLGPSIARDDQRAVQLELEEILRKDPLQHDALYLLGEIYTHSATHSDSGKAVDAYARLLDLDPGLSLVYEHLLNACLRAGRLDEARLRLADWEARKPTNLRLLQGTMALWEGRLQDASTLLPDPLIPDVLAGLYGAPSLRAVFEKDPDALADSLAGLSGTYLALELDLRADIFAMFGRFEEAADLYRRSAAVPGIVSLDGFHTSVRNGARQRLAFLLALRGDLPGAWRELAVTLEQQPDSYRCLYIAGLFKIRAGELDAARARLASLEDLVGRKWSPSAPLYRNALAAELALVEGRDEEARAGFLGLLRSDRLMEDWYAHEDSLEPFVRDGLARSYAAAGDAAGTSEALAGLIDSGLPRLRNPVLWVSALGTRGWMEWQLGNEDVARELLEQFVALWGETELPEVVWAKELLGS